MRGRPFLLYATIAIPPSLSAAGYHYVIRDGGFGFKPSKTLWKGTSCLNRGLASGRRLGFSNDPAPTFLPSAIRVSVVHSDYHV